MGFRGGIEPAAWTREKLSSSYHRTFRRQRVRCPVTRPASSCPPSRWAPTVRSRLRRASRSPVDRARPQAMGPTKRTALSWFAGNRDSIFYNPRPSTAPSACPKRALERRSEQHPLSVIPKGPPRVSEPFFIPSLPFSVILTDVEGPLRVSEPSSSPQRPSFVRHFDHRGQISCRETTFIVGLKMAQ